MATTRPPYPPEFRREAVRLVKANPDKSIPEIAAELGVSGQSLRNWVKQDDIDNGVVDGVTSDEREELTRLRRENTRLREEREILKKAAAFFATENR